ncbi:AraC family transcriptional regulator [Pendulispora rubella]|uniref:AraC family transcriptional regulator n=1 Tax=Pendulispora rubella TaxID=2741070 RepID=A0ABZ2L2I2_9BACT
MKRQDLTRPIVPIVYGVLILDLALERGATRAAMLSELEIPETVWNTPDARLSLVQLDRLLYRAVRLTGDGALGYEIGFRCGVTMHGLFGLGAMSLGSIREMVAFGIKFLPVRLPNVKLSLIEGRPRSALEVAEATSLGSLRRQTLEIALVGAMHLATEILERRRPGSDADLELWFDYPEPEYYASYRSRLPPAHFDMAANRLFFPTELLDRPLRACNPITAEMMRQQCERELALLGLEGDFPSRVRAALPKPGGGYHSASEVSARLFVSSRTLKRRLAEHATSFQRVLDELRQHESMRLLQDPALAIEHVAERLAYADPANFTRAFRKWMGITPSEYRTQFLSRAR